MRKFILVILLLFIISFFIFSNTIYGDKDPVELLFQVLPKYKNNWCGTNLEEWEKRQDFAIIMHIIDDSFIDIFYKKYFGLSIIDLDNETRQKGIVFWFNETYEKPVLLISAVSIRKIKEELTDNNSLINALNKMWILGEREFRNINVDITKKESNYDKNFLKEGSAYILYYGDKKYSYNRNGGLSLGNSSNLIFYKNPNKEYYLTSIKIIGKFNGSPEKKFHLIIKDNQGKPVYMSETYQFKDFSNGKFEMKEFYINSIEKLDEFYIEIYTDFIKVSELFFADTPTNINYFNKLKAVYKKDEEIQNKNFFIFPKFEKENKNNKTNNYIPEFVLNNGYEFNVLRSKNSTFLRYEKKGLKFEDLINKMNEVSNKIEKIKIGVTNNIELINILGQPQVVEISLKEQNDTYNYKYGNITFVFDNNLLIEYGIANILSPFFYGESIKIGSTIDEVYTLVGKPKNIIIGISVDDIVNEDQVFYKNINNWEGSHLYSIDKLGVRFYFWHNKVYAIYQYKSKNIEETKFKIEYKENNYLDSISFILKNLYIHHLASGESYDSFWTVFEPLLYQVYIYSNVFYLNRDVEMREKFSIFSYIKSKEDKYKHYEIMKPYINISKEEIDNQVSEKTSLIFYKEREGKEPILLLAAYDEENMKKVYQSLKNKTTISEGIYILSHQELDK